MFETLVAHGADMNAEDSNGNNILHVLVGGTNGFLFSFEISRHYYFVALFAHRFTAIIRVLMTISRRRGLRYMETMGTQKLPTDPEFHLGSAETVMGSRRSR